LGNRANAGLIPMREANLHPLPDCGRVWASATLRVMNASISRQSLRFSRTTRIALLSAPLAFTVILAACTKTAAQQGTPPPPQVAVAPVIEREVTEWDELTGGLQAVDSVEVRPRVSGLVSSVRFSEGA